MRWTGDDSLLEKYNIKMTAQWKQLVIILSNVIIPSYYLIIWNRSFSHLTKLKEMASMRKHILQFMLARLICLTIVIEIYNQIIYSLDYLHIPNLHQQKNKCQVAPNRILTTLSSESFLSNLCSLYCHVNGRWITQIL